MSALSSTKLSPWGARLFVTSANLMRRAELGQRWLTAYETHSLTDLMRPLFHTNSWFFLHLSHTNGFPSSYMGDLRICIKVQHIRLWFVSVRRLWTTEWQKCQFWRSVIWIYGILVCLSNLSKVLSLPFGHSLDQSFNTGLKYGVMIECATLLSINPVRHLPC